MALNAAAAYVGQTETAAAIQGSLTASYWDQWKGYVPGVTVEPPGDVDPPVEGPPTPAPQPEMEGPPTPPSPELEGPPSPVSANQGDVTIGGDSNLIQPD